MVYKLVTKGTIDENIYKFAQNNSNSIDIIEDSEYIEVDNTSKSDVETMEKILGDCLK